MIKWDIIEIFVRGKIIGQVTKLWIGKMFTSERNKKCRDFQDLRRGKARGKKGTVGSSLCCGSYSAPFIHSLLSSFVVDREWKEEARGKSRIFRGILLVTNAISRNGVDTILLQKYFKDLMNTGYITDKVNRWTYKI